MRVSAKAEYACVAMLELAASYNAPEPVRIKAIADAQGIPQRFLVQILIQLKTAGLVVSVRGAAGGYQLSRPPEAVSLAQVINAIDDRSLTSPSAAFSDAAKRRQPRRNASGEVTAPVGGILRTPAIEALLSVWREIQAEEQRLLEGLSLAELLRRSHQSNALSYQI
jgi:Rrf2 family protein